MIQYNWTQAAARPKTTHWKQYGAVYLFAIATPLLLADQMRHVLQDAGLWPAPSSSMFRDDCDDVTGLKAFTCLTLVGWLFTVICTYTGFICMLTGVFMSADLANKKRNDACGQIPRVRGLLAVQNHFSI
eukprot:gene6957-2228_t